MFRIQVVAICVVLSAAVVTGFARQTQKKVPTIIRDTGVAEGKTDPETAVKKEYSPALAEKNLDIGKQYMKKGNYDAAIQRFQDAIDYHPALADAYDALGRAYEKKGDIGRAAATYREYVKRNPDSNKVAEFKERGDRLEKELEKKK